MAKTAPKWPFFITVTVQVSTSRHSLKSSGTMLVSLFLFLKPNKFASVKQQKCIRDIMGEPLMAVCNLQTPQLHCIQKSKWTGEVVRVHDQQKCVKNSGQSGTKMTRHNKHCAMPLCVFLVTLFSLLHTRPAIMFHTVKLVCFQSPMWMKLKYTKCNNQWRTQDFISGWR